MATNYPLSFDDATTIGGPFVNAAPPVDPFEDIDAVRRNNLNETVLAIEARLGVLDSSVTTSADWGTLTVSGVPNQGARFAGTHTQWPGLVAESGIFVDDSSGNVSYHKSGEPVATFYDLTGGGGISSWDAIYASDPNLNLLSVSTDDEPFRITQTSDAGHGLHILRNKEAGFSDAPIVRIENASGLDDQAALRVEARTDSQLALDVFGQLLFSGDGRVYTNSGSSPLTLETTADQSAVNINTYGNQGHINLLTSATVQPSNINITSASQLTLTTTGTAALGIYANASLNLIVGQDLDITASGGTWNMGTPIWNVTHPGNNNNGCNITLQGASLINWSEPQCNRITASNSHFTVQTASGSKDLHLQGGRDLFFAARGSAQIPFNDASNLALTTTNQTVVGAINEVAASGGTPSWDDIYAADKVLNITGLSFEIQNTLATASNPSFKVTRNNTATGNSMVSFSDDSATASHPTLEVVSAGTTGTAVLSLAYGTHTGTVGVNQSAYLALGAITTADISLYTTGLQPHTDDTSGATYRGFYAIGSATGSAVKHGFVADTNWDYGLHSSSDVMLTGSVLYIGETATPTAVTNYGAFYNKSDNKPYFQNGAGTEHEMLLSTEYASMYLDDNSTATIMGYLDDVTGLNYFSSGTLDGWTFGAGSTGTVSAYADYSGTVPGTVLATTSTHGLTTGDYVTLQRTTNYGGLYQVTVVSATTFYFTATWAGNDGSSWFAHPSYLQAGANSAGTYRVEYSVTCYAFDEIDIVTVFTVYKNTTSIDESSSVVRLASLQNHLWTIAVGGALVSSVSTGDRIYLTAMNIAPGFTDGTLCRYGSVCVSRV